MKITICRKAHFNAAHKLYNPGLSNEENFKYLENVVTKIFMFTTMS